MDKLFKRIGSVILGVLIFLLLVSIMVFIPAIVLNYILVSLGVAVSLWLSVSIVVFIYIIAICVKNI
ncbi:hypothetical protein [Staphylococcus phage VB-SauS-SA2]|nr:hypothetical protein [Staphylococcus phage VB-SauS-SA2]